MKATALLAVCLALFSVGTVHGQERVEAGELEGVWRLVFNIDEGGETAMERVILNAVDGLLDEVNVRFEFKPGGTMLVYAEAFGDADEEKSRWSINPEGELLLGDNEHVDIDDTVWLRDGSRLVAYEYGEDGRGERKDGIFMERVRD